MNSTRGRDDVSLFNFSLQDFGALAWPGLRDSTALQSVMASGIGRLGSFALGPRTDSLAQNHTQSAAAAHGVAPLSLARHAFSTTQPVHTASYSNGYDYDSAGDHAVASIRPFSIAANGVSALFAPTLDLPAIAVPHVESAVHTVAHGFAHAFDSANHSVLHNGAPPPSAAIYGQLWFGGVGASADDQLGHIDSDAFGRDVADLTTSHVAFQNVGLDPASGLYFGITADGLLRDGHITNDQETNEASQIATIDMVFGSGPSADEVQALAVDPLNHLIYVALRGQFDGTTGILEVQYNPTTGALTSPYNASTGTVTDFNHMLFQDNSVGLVNGVTAMTNVIAMQYDMQNGNLYYVDQTNGTPVSGSGVWQATNGIYVVSATGSVGGGTAPTPTLLSLNSQFAAGDNNNYIEGLAINEAQGIIYFAVNNASSNTSKLYWMPLSGGTATQMSIPAGVTFGFADNNGAGVNPLAFDPNGRQLYVSDSSDSHLVQFTLSADGHSFTSGNSNFMIFDGAGSSTTGLYFDPLPTLSGLTATATDAVEGSNAVTLLTAAPTISDPQDGVTNKLHMGYLQVVIANAQAGDRLFYNGLQSGTFDSGKMTISWNSATHTLTLTGNETEAFYDTLFQNITFQDSGTDGSTGSHPTRTINWTISDGTTVEDQTIAGPNERSTTLTIDRSPTVVTDNYALAESATSTGTGGTGGTGVLHNDSDADGDSFSVTAVNGFGANVGNAVAGTYGHLTLNANGSYAYIADQTSNIDNAATGSHPVDSFTYTASDGLGGVSSTTVTFTIDRAPTVVADNPSGEALESGSPITGNVLSNDSDKDGDAVTVSAVAGLAGNVGNSIAGTYGHMTINSNGTYSYTADNTAAIDGAATGSHLTDTFSYTASDGLGGTTTTNITVTVDRAPTVVSDSPSTEAVEGAGATSLGNVLSNDSDRDGDSLVVFAVNGLAGNVGNSVAGTYGHVTINSNGTYSYTADNTAAINGAATGSHLTDTFTYTASDGLGGTTTTNIVVTIDRPPTVVADNPSGQALESGLAVTGNVLSNDSDRDGDTLVVSAVAGSAGNVGSSIAGVYGHITINSNGTYSYTADNTAAIDGAATGTHLTDTFSYTASDGLGGTTTTNITVTVDRAPTVVSDSPSTDAVEGAGATSLGSVLSNDSDRDGDSLVVSAVNGLAGNVGGSVAGTYGHITINSNGTYSYTADNTAAIDGAATGTHLTDTFSYTASDGLGGTTTTNVTVTIDRAPTVVNDSGGALGEGGSASASAAAGVLTDDSDRDGDSLTISAVGGSSANVGISFATTYGHITLNADGSYSYIADNTAAIDAAASGSHPVDTVTFTVSDGFGGTTSETLSFTIDRPASATADSLTTFENTQAINGSGGNLNLLANDVDKDGDAITITAVNGSGANVGTQIVLASGALLTVNADGTYTYDPNHAFDYLPGASSGASNTAATDTFTYTVDGGSTVTVTVNVTGVDSNDTLIGTTGNDTLHAGIGNDIIYDDNGQMNGTDPHDTSAGHSGGTDTFFGDSGNDTIYMGANLIASDQIDGGTNTDTVVLNGDYSGGVVFNATTMVNVEILQLNAGHSYNLTMANATVAAGQTLTVQADLLGAGDALTFNASADTTGGNFIINSGAGNDVLTGGNGNDTFRVGAGNDTVHGGGGADLIIVKGNLTAADTIDGGSGIDAVYLNGDYSAGVTLGATTLTGVEIMRLVAGNSYNLTMNAATVAAGSTLTVLAGALQAANTVTFDGSADTAGGSFLIYSGAGNDVLTGGNGNDLFYSGTGTDTVHGGGGNDTILMKANFTAADTIDGGTGNDKLVLSGDYSGGVTFGATTLTNVETIQLIYGNSYNLTMNAATVAAGSTLTVQAGALKAANTVTFNGSADTAGGNFVIDSGAGNDVLTGGNGNDLFDPATGTDTMHGGGGNDTFQMYGTFTAADAIDGGTGNDELDLAGNYSGGVVFGATTLTNVETIQLAYGHSYNLTINNATVAAGQTLTVLAGALLAANTVTFNGSADTTGGDLLIYSGAGNDVLTGGNGNDLFDPGAGTDTIHGGGGNDTFQLRAQFTAADTIDGGTGNDTLALSGDYSSGVVFGATTLTNVETIVLASSHSYNLTINTATVAAGQTLTVDGNSLLATDSFVFNGSNDTTGGALAIYGGAGNDTLTGGSGNDLIKAGDGTNIITGGGGSDTLYGGIGADRFVYNSVAESTSTGYDKVKNFDASADTFKITNDTINAVNTALTSGHLSLATFDSDLTSDVGSAQLGVHDAVLFTADTGTLRGHTFLIVDVNGIAGYQAGQDIVMDLTGGTHLNTLSTGNFVT